MITYLLFPVGLFLLFYGVVLSFFFKKRRLASLICLWGVLGTLVVSFIVDYLTRIPFLSDIPGYGYVVVCFIPIYYFFTLYQSYRAYGSGLGAFISTFFQFIGQMAVLILIMGFWGVYSIFMTTDYQANTPDLKQEAPSKFTESSKLEYPNDAELIHTSYSYWGRPNVGIDIIIRVEDIDSFIESAVTKYKFYEMAMDFPNHDREYLGYGFDPFQNTLKPPFCEETKTIDVKPRYFKVTRQIIDPEDFCGERNVYFSQIDKDAELSITMVIFPEEGLVWLNHSEWF
jgi:hypothetical protein